MMLAHDRIHRIVRLGVLAAYAIGVEWIGIRAGSPMDPWWWLLEIPFALWIIAPIAVPLLLPVRHWLLTGGVTVMAAYSLYVYVDGMFGPGARSTSGLIFIFLPAYQWLGTAILIAAAALLNRKIGQRAAR